MSHDRPIPLSERVPVLENMGFRVVDERTYHIQPRDAADVWFHDMTLESAWGQPIELSVRKERIEACFLAVMGGRAENDGYNALVLATGLVWREVALIRALSRFLRQIRVPYSQDYMWATLRKHAAIAAQIVTLFHTRFDPHLDVPPDERAAREPTSPPRSKPRCRRSTASTRIASFAASSTRSRPRSAPIFISPDRRRDKDLIAVKFASRKLDDMPLPRPLYEIFVYSPRVEGVHLRFGKVARGGIRWSDRPQDFRTEILGLVKAQNVKNAVIVPVGAKGGFVPKHLPSRRFARSDPGRGRSPPTSSSSRRCSTSPTISEPERRASSRRPTWCATTATIPISWSPPTRARRPSPTSPTTSPSRTTSGSATPSPPAARPATTTRRWASPRAAPGNRSSAISARWTSTSRTTPFTVVGVGDMSGDVFGNGMLREKTTKLVAAFDHRDIFIDPDPDAERTFAERQRLFDLPRSSWQDFDKTLISKGGGVFPRSAKEIRLSREAQKLFGVGERLTPQELIRAILKAQVDLLFFGGIGTYVRAADESDEAVGDRANDAVRIAGQGSALQGDRRGRQSRHDPARPHRGGVCAASGSTPTPSTIRPASTPPTWRSTSRSR